jgi:molybdopterin-guanine dinucleotide biosynthesis adapter protein
VRTQSRTHLSSPIVGIAGWKKSGKTTLAVRLVEEFTKRGLRVATIKHAHHDFQIDNSDTDSARHRRAGAKETAIVSGKRWAIVHDLENEPEPDFEEVVSWLSPADLIIVEGYKSAPIPKIEARRTASMTKLPLADDDPMVFAIAADHDVDESRLPVFTLDDVTGLADLIAQRLGLDKARPAETGGTDPANVTAAKSRQ